MMFSYTEFSRQKVLRIAVFVYSYVYAIDFFKKNIFSVNKTDVHVIVLLFIELFDFFFYMFGFLILVMSF